MILKNLACILSLSQIYKINAIGNEVLFDDDVPGVNQQSEAAQAAESSIQPEVELDEDGYPLRSIGVQIDQHSDPMRVEVLNSKQWNMCGYPAVPHNSQLFNVGPATEISNSYPLPQRKYERFENGTFGSVDRIVDGDESSVHSWPWQVRVRPCSNYRCTFLCGGSIISKQWVLTAAHCIPYRANKGNITVGNHYVWTDEQLDPFSKNHTISKIVNHHGWNKYTRVNDITLIQVHVAFTYNSHVSPVCLPTQDTCITYGSACAVTGWGYTAANKISPTLQELAVRLISYKKCRSAMYYSGAVYPTQVCAGFAEGGKDSCSGDSGGPLVCKASGMYNQFVLYGVVSWGYGCAREYKPGVYTRVTSFLPWIYEKMHGEDGGQYLEVGPKSPGTGSCLSCNAKKPGQCDPSIDIKKSPFDGKQKTWVAPTSAPPTTKAPATVAVSEDESNVIDDTCGATFTDVSDSISWFSTPNYPDNYSPSTTCEWFIGENDVRDATGAQKCTFIKVKEADMGTTKCARNDKITITCASQKKRQILCKAKGTMITCPGKMSVKFQSNKDSKVSLGALLAYKIKNVVLNDCGLDSSFNVNPNDPFSTNVLSVWPVPRSKVCNFNIQCPDNTKCRITISTRTVLGAVERRNRKTKKVQLMKCMDKATMYDGNNNQMGKVCGRYSYRNNRVFMSNDNTAKITLEFDGRASKSERFEATVTLVKIRG